MQNQPLRLEDLQLESWPNLILWAAPIMFLLVFIEWGISWYQKRDAYDTKDFLAASTIGLVNVGISAMIKLATFGVALFFYNLAPFKIPATWWSFIVCFVAIDFARYWAHRVAHEQRFLVGNSYHAPQQFQVQLLGFFPFRLDSAHQDRLLHPCHVDGL